MSLKALMDSFKKETTLLGPVQRHLLAQQKEPTTRRQDVIHPSELVASSVCPRAIYYRLLGQQAPSEEIAFQLDVIFAAGHGYHDKWQNWAWGAGILRGRFRCLSCGHGDWETPGFERKHTWYATSPEACESCGAMKRFLTYGEVPIFMPEYRIAGHADGDLDVTGDEAEDPILEVKSIGDGTVRMAAPRLLAKHTKKVEVDGEEKTWTDWQALWRDIKRPFKPHVKQVTLYCLALGRTSAVILYEYKPTGAVKEFRIDIDPATVVDELALAEKVVRAVEEGKPPRCPHKGCAKCRAFENTDEAQDETTTRPTGREDQGSATREGAARDQGPEDPASSAGRVPRDQPRRRVRGVERPRGDRRDAGVHSLGGLLGRAARPGGVERGGGGEVLPAREGRGDAPDRGAEGAGPARESRSRVVRRGS